MRSSNKQRSRNKNNNRSRNVGNVMNRVFNSAGPEGKVNGTPSQIIDKYQAMARDAQLSGDRVAAENFQQHAEHYTRLLSEAQREQAERQARDDRQREQQQNNANTNGGGNNAGQQNGGASHGGGGQDRQRSGGDQQPFQDDQPQPEVAGLGEQPAPSGDVLGGGADLVETPEAGGADQAQAKPRKPRSRARRAAPKSDDAAPAADAGADTPAE